MLDLQLEAKARELQAATERLEGQASAQTQLEQDRKNLEALVKALEAEKAELSKKLDQHVAEVGSAYDLI